MLHIGDIEGELENILDMGLSHDLDRATYRAVMPFLMSELVRYVNNRMVESYWQGVYDGQARQEGVK